MGEREKCKMGGDGIDFPTVTRDFEGEVKFVNLFPRSAFRRRLASPSLLLRFSLCLLNSPFLACSVE